MRTVLFWAITQPVVVIPYRHFGTDWLSQNVNKEFPLHTAQQTRRVEFSSTELIYVPYCIYGLTVAEFGHFKNNTFMVSCT